MELADYQTRARRTALYPKHDLPTYPALKLVGEAGEVAEHIGKAIRDDQARHGKITPDRRAAIKAELGDVLWYVSNVAYDLDLSLEEIAWDNLKKLHDRMERGVIGGSGSNR